MFCLVIATSGDVVLLTRLLARGSGEIAVGSKQPG